MTPTDEYRLIASLPKIANINEVVAYKKVTAEKLVFIYEAQRDYLSVPRTYVVLEFIVVAGEALDVVRGKTDKKTWSEFALYEKLSSQNGCFVIVEGNNTYTIENVVMRHADTVYHCASAEEALLIFE